MATIAKAAQGRQSRGFAARKAQREASNDAHYLGDFAHFGTVTIGAHNYQWKEKAGGEIFFRREDRGEKAPYERIDDLKLSEEQRLTLINNILAYYRPHAMPDAQEYRAAAALLTHPYTDAQGRPFGTRFFIGMNNEANIVDPFAGRGCAETSALRKAQETIGRPDVPVQAVYLMSGKLTIGSDGIPTEMEAGHMSCPCGECRQNLEAHFKREVASGHDPRFVVLPTNDGRAPLTLNATATAANELAENQGWVIPPETLYPLQPVILSQEQSEKVRAGYQAIISPQNQAFKEIPFPQVGQTTNAEGKPSVVLSLDDFRALKASFEKAGLACGALAKDAPLTDINAQLLRLIRTAYAQQQHHNKPLEITAVLVQDTRGNFYPAVQVDGELWLPSKPSPFVAALMNAGNDLSICKAYSMTFDTRELAEMEEIGNGDYLHSLKLPNPAELGRLLKNARNTEGKDVEFTVIPVNDGTLTEAELGAGFAYTDSAARAFGPGFTNPKAMEPHKSASAASR